MIELPGCSIALKCANEPLSMLERCIDSIDDNVSINVVATPNDATERFLKKREIPFTITEYGNIAKSAELSVREAEHDNVIVMDVDTWFFPGSIRKIREALVDSVFAKPRLEFLQDSYGSKLVSNKRHKFNNRPDYVACPGIAMRRAEVRERCGGYIFNPAIRWTEDADLNFRAKRAGLSVAFVQDALLFHQPITVRHELKAAMLYGAGKRLSVEQTPGRIPSEDMSSMIRSVTDGRRMVELAKRYYPEDPLYIAFSSLWYLIYLAGYHTQKHTGRWTPKGEVL